MFSYFDANGIGGRSENCRNVFWADTCAAQIDDPVLLRIYMLYGDKRLYTDKRVHLRIDLFKNAVGHFAFLASASGIG